MTGIHLLSRWSAGVALVTVGFAAAGVFAIWFLADLYARYGSEVRAARADDPVAEQAAALAVQLAPWNSSYHADYAWSLSAKGDSAGMRKQYRMALRLDPANPYRWVEYEQLLSRWRRFDHEFTQAAHRAAQLAPNSRPVEFHNAWIGVNYWTFGDEAARASWAGSMIHILGREPQKLLHRIVAARRESTFCGFVGAELGLGRWCQAIAWARPICEQAAPEQARTTPWCQDLGLSQ